MENRERGERREKGICVRERIEQSIAGKGGEQTGHGVFFFFFFFWRCVVRGCVPPQTLSPSFLSLGKCISLKKRILKAALFFFVYRGKNQQKYLCVCVCVSMCCVVLSPPPSQPKPLRLSLRSPSLQKIQVLEKKTKAANGNNDFFAIPPPPLLVYEMARIDIVT